MVTEPQSKGHFQTMHYFWSISILATLFIGANVNGYLIRVYQSVSKWNGVLLEDYSEMNAGPGVDKNDFELNDDTTSCAKVGEFCRTNKDCCSNSCLGFMARCVSGSRNSLQRK